METQPFENPEITPPSHNPEQLLLEIQSKLDNLVAISQNSTRNKHDQVTFQDTNYIFERLKDNPNELETFVDEDIKDAWIFNDNHPRILAIYRINPPSTKYFTLPDCQFIPELDLNVIAQNPNQQIIEPSEKNYEIPSVVHYGTEVRPHVIKAIKAYKLSETFSETRILETLDTIITALMYDETFHFDIKLVEEIMQLKNFPCDQITEESLVSFINELLKDSPHQIKQ